MSGSTRIIQRLAKALITDRNHPGFAFPYRGMHSSTWEQTKSLLKHDEAWQHPRTWKYNSECPGKPFTSLLDRIRKDHVYRLNLIVHGGWTEETFRILVDPIEVAKSQKRWNQLYGSISYEDRLDYYKRRDELFQRRGQICDSDELQDQHRDQPIPNYEGTDAERMVHRFGKGKRIAAASKAPTAAPGPETRFPEIWQLSRAARLGYPSVPEFLQDAKNRSLPSQKGAPDGAAGSSTDTYSKRVVLLPKQEIFECLQCCEPSALTNLWKCVRCSSAAGKPVYFHRPSRYKNCYTAHEHYCEAATLFEWRQ